MDPPTSGVSRMRREAVPDHLETRVATADQIGRWFFGGRAPPENARETARKKADRWLRKQAARGRIRVAGYVMPRGTGRPMVTYGKSNERELEHDWWTSEIELLM